MNESGELRWYVAHTYAGYENKVKDNIEKTVENRNLHDVIAEVCVPTEEVTVLVEKKKKKTSNGKKKASEDYVEIDSEDAKASDKSDVEVTEKVVQRKTYPGYVFVKMIMTSESWYIVRNTRGCTGFVGPDSKPVPLTEEEVFNIGLEKPKPKVVEINFQVGDSVRITEGSMRDFMGEVKSIDIEHMKAVVIVSMFGGRDVEIEIDIDKLEV